MKLNVPLISRERYNMKKKSLILSVAFVVMTIAASGQRTFADSYALLNKGHDGLSTIVNNVFNTGYANNLAFSSDVGGPAGINLSNEFRMDRGSIFVLSSRGSVDAIIVDGIPRTPVVSVDLANPSYFGSGTVPLFLDCTSAGISMYNSQLAHDNFIVFNVTDLFTTFLENYFSDGSTYDGNAYLVGFDTWNMAFAGDNTRPYDNAVFLVLDSFWKEPPRDPNVPEPASVVLWTLGGLSLACTSRARNRRMKKLAL